MMSRLASVVLVSCVLDLTGCATIASGPYGSDLDASGKATVEAQKVALLRISVRELIGMSSRYFGELEVTLENPTSHWVRIENITLDFGGEPANRLVSFPWGGQLESWVEATQQRNLVRAANNAAAMEMVGLGGAVLGVAASGRRGAEPILGGLATLAALSSVANQTASDAALHPVFAGQHLFALPLEVPPGLFAKRFVVVNTPADAQQPCLRSMIMTYELADHSLHRVALQFRYAGATRTESEWQRDFCQRAGSGPTRMR